VRCRARYTVIGQRLPVNLALHPFSLFAVERVECSQRRTGVSAATDVSTQLAVTLTSKYNDCRTRPQILQKNLGCQSTRHITNSSHNQLVTRSTRRRHRNYKHCIFIITPTSTPTSRALKQNTSEDWQPKSLSLHRSVETLHRPILGRERYCFG